MYTPNGVWGITLLKKLIRKAVTPNGQKNKSLSDEIKNMAEP
jgi:hypothetical protein